MPVDPAGTIAAVPKTFVERALVPNAARTSVLVVAGERASLPSWSVEDPDPADILRAARASGITAPFLREVRQDGDSLHDDEVRSLLEFDVADGTATRDLPDGHGGIIEAATVHRVALAELGDRFATVVPRLD